MDFNCNDCGKSYNIDTDKLEAYRGRMVRFRCQSCRSITEISQLLAEADQVIPIEDFETPEAKSQKIVPILDTDQFSDDSLGFGIRSKMIFLFLFLPVFIFAGAIFLNDYHMEELRNLLVEARIGSEESGLSQEALADETTRALMEDQNDFKVNFIEKTYNIRTNNNILLMFALFVFSLSSVIFSFRITARIKILMEIADRISLGDLDADLKTMSGKDEITALADAFGRMQDSLRFSLKKLHRSKARR